ncbi:hypothetical protein Ahy_A09g042335 isoform A [Arachis hypogaea]|uniref:Aminotransferase-like plant mobile domain-containing protein n=1 Tax=Arachis hypogaea TaxID=3818 RepID=A0A445BFK2_ARAHY|nr:hypothetical protein Ahy_A09g042335 isoform A [Arachis hypogaea]
MGTYSWGSAALAWLYRCMCRVANRHVVKLAGSLQLLQSWIFWCFPRFRPAGYDTCSWPLASRYPTNTFLFQFKIVDSMFASYDDPNRLYRLDGVAHIAGAVHLEDLLGVLPPANCIDKFTVKYTWFEETFSELPQGADEETVRRYARA